MSTQSPRMILVATDGGLYHVNGGVAARVDELAGHEVRALAIDGGGGWAIVEGRELWRSAEGDRWSLAATVPRWKATCLAASAARGGLLLRRRGGPRGVAYAVGRPCRCPLDQLRGRRRRLRQRARGRRPAVNGRRRRVAADTRHRARRPPGACPP